MTTGKLPIAFSLAEAEVSGPRTRLQGVWEGDFLRIYTGSYYLQRWRWLARTVGLLCIIAGAALVGLSPWTLALAVPGLLILLLVPLYLHPSLLLEIDGARDLLIPVQPTLGTNVPVPLDLVCSIRGAYDTKGWDSFSILYAVLDDGTEIPLMMLLGTDESLVENACRLLGRMLDCPATYTGPFGHTTTCYTPS